MIEAVFEDIAISHDGTQIFVLLRTKNGDLLPIVIDALQMHSIAAARSREKFPRPLTHDLMITMLEMLDAQIKRIEVTDLVSNPDGSGTFYARLILENRGVEFDIDCRPSDALALAVRVEAPLYIAESVIERAALSEAASSEFGGGSGGVEA